jgi:hypothetical protein
MEWVAPGEGTGEEAADGSVRPVQAHRPTQNSKAADLLSLDGAKGTAAEGEGWKQTGRRWKVVIAGSFRNHHDELAVLAGRIVRQPVVRIGKRLGVLFPRPAAGRPRA